MKTKMVGFVLVVLSWSWASAQNIDPYRNQKNLRFDFNQTGLFVSHNTDYTELCSNYDIVYLDENEVPAYCPNKMSSVYLILSEPKQCFLAFEVDLFSLGEDQYPKSIAFLSHWIIAVDSAVKQYKKGIPGELDTIRSRIENMMEMYCSEADKEKSFCDALESKLRQVFTLHREPHNISKSRDAHYYNH
ncbi:MAG: hypothetical protein R3A11_07915 [Bdellovibrionota bacterium]